MKADYITPKVWKVLYSQMCYENAIAIRLSLETGLRIGDVVSLPSSSLDGKEITFRASKTGKVGRCSISSDLAKRLHTILGSKYIFEGRACGKHRTRQAVYKDLRNVASQYGLLEHVSPHSARKTYAVGEYKEHGLKAVQRELQHDRAETTLIYALADKITESSVLRPSDGVSSEAVDLIARRVVELLSEKLGLNSSGV